MSCYERDANVVCEDDHWSEGQGQSMRPDEIFNAGGNAAAASAAVGGGVDRGRSVTPYHILYHCAGHARSAIRLRISLQQLTTDQTTGHDANAL